MSTFQPYNDTPEKIKLEGQQITLTATKIGPSTAQLNWDIPNGVTGCDGLAYNGIIITVNSVENTPQTAPVDGQIYIGDPTVDSNLHAGSKLNEAMVIVDLYDDKITTTATIEGLLPNTAYYYTAHAVDAVNRYHTEGVHAYSQTLGSADRPELPGYNEIKLGYDDHTELFDVIQNGTATGVQLSASTGLDPDNVYTFQLKSNTCCGNIDCEPVDVRVNGLTSQTYQELLDSINYALVNLCLHPELTAAPNGGCIYFNEATNQLFVWDGTTYTELPVIIQDNDPNIPLPDQYWLDTDTGVLKQYDALSSPSPTWDTVPVITYYKDPTDLDQTDFWCDGITVRRWEGSTWCDRVTVIQTTDPSLSTVPDTGTYWFNTLDNIMYTWTELCTKWLPRDVLYTPSDPNIDLVDSFWFDTANQKLNVREGSPLVWAEYSERYEVSKEEPSSPSVNTIWVDDVNDIMYTRDSLNLVWEETPAIFYHEDPLNRESCELWWNSTTDELNVWDIVNSTWVLVQTFLQQDLDPNLPLVTEPTTFWYNPDTGVALYWDGSEWLNKNVIYFLTDPTQPLEGNAWHNTTDDVWSVWEGSPASWVETDVFKWNVAPGLIELGTHWKTDTALAMWNGVGWVGLVFQTVPCEPDINFIYFNSTDNVVYQWTATGWVPQEMPATVRMNEAGNMIFESGVTGSSAFIEINDGTLFASLAVIAFICDPVMGKDDISGTPTYAVEGIGTDSSSDEHRNLVMQLRGQLGGNAYKVELTKTDFDTAIRLALEELRRRSASAYSRDFFFLDIEPGVQKYELSNKKVGFHKVVKVMAAYRIQSSFLGNATGQGAYGQAMLQHLYQMGSFDLLSYHIISGYVELMNELFAAYLVFNWRERTRMLSFFQTFGSNERVLIDAMIERTEQDLLTDRTTKTWIEKFALGKCQMMLSEIRGKYATLPGAGGGVSLNASDLQVKGEANLEWCEAELVDFIANEIETVGMGGDFILG